MKQVYIFSTTYIFINIIKIQLIVYIYSILYITYFAVHILNSLYTSYAEEINIRQYYRYIVLYIE